MVYFLATDGVDGLLSIKVVENLRNVRQQEIEFFKQNGQKQITPDQESQLTAMLQRNPI